MIKIVIDKDIPFLEGVFEPFAEVTAIEGRRISRADVCDAEVLVVRTRTRCDASLLEGSAVRTLITATIGTDHIDLEWCRRNGIEVFNAAGCNARGVLQWVAAVLVHILKIKAMKPSEVTLGVVGAGNVGSLVEEYAVRWGFNVLCCDPPREEREHRGFLPVEEIFRQADIITLHVPLDSSTHHLIDDRLLNTAKSGAILINSSRGEVVNTEALLHSGVEFALDVWENEPDICPSAAERAIVATPHIAGYSLQGKANASARVAEILAERYGMPLSGWYPAGVRKTVPQPISWQDLCSSIGRYFDLEAESCRFKADTGKFEQLRNNYDYREEYF